MSFRAQNKRKRGFPNTMAILPKLVGGTNLAAYTGEDAGGQK